MKLLFICGSVEPGKNGVGDYCLQLGHELARFGIKSYFLAWNDAFVDEVQETSNTLRFPKNTSSELHLQKARDFIQDNKIGAISLQWVAYAYNKKGLPISFANDLKSLAKLVSKRHLMVHEIWIGVEPDSPLKHKWVGKIQRIVFSKAVRNWRPKVSHTQAPFYQDHLKKIGLHTKLLPLFGNIPIAKKISNESIDPDTITGILFGSIPNDADFAPFLRILNQQAEKADCQVRIQCIGRNGDAYNALAEAVKSHSNLSIDKSGYLSEEAISYELQKAHFGLGVARPHLLCKSGVVAAFNEHGLPILSTRKGKVPEVLFSEKYLEVPLIELDALEHISIRELKRSNPKPKALAVAQSMADDLTSV